jgi:carbonic anhydrase
LQRLAAALLLALPLAATAQHDHAANPAAAASQPPVRTNLGSTRKDIETTIREALSSGEPTRKRLNLLIDKSAAESPAPAVAPTAATPAVASRLREPGLVIRPRATTAHKEVHWSYEGEGGPAQWGALKPEYATCASGKRQSPIAIDDSDTLKGPAEAIQFRYTPSKGTVVNNGHTIQVNVYGDNSLTVRGSTYQLLQFHFHHPSEERINGQSYPMVGHFVHRNDLGQLAVLAVLLQAGEAGNRLIERVWTYMPLDANDSVRMPPDLIDVNDILPRERLYYQYLGSLTTPPCTEGVLWLVMKQPVAISREQLRLFAQLYPHNARPVQPLNGRPVREAVQLLGEPAPR